MTFKDLKKKVSVSQESQQQTRFFDRLVDKPFWVWNTDYHRQEDINTGGDCCFNHIIGLPRKDGLERPIFDYEKIIFDCLQDNDNNHLWIKKATGLGITEFMLRFMPGFA